MKIAGVVRSDKKTKELAKRISSRELALISHRDLDQVAAKSLVRAGVRAVINTESSISGKYPNLGPGVLLEEGIPLIDEADSHLLQIIKDGERIEIRDGGLIYCRGRPVGRGQELTRELLEERMAVVRQNLADELDDFVENTLSYARQEKSLLLGLRVPEPEVQIEGRQALVVVRGTDYLEDLQAIEAYIREIRPVIIGVDGGADGCLKLGLKPDIIIGDMDSVSDGALLSGAELMVHAYPDGRAPGRKRIRELELEATIFPAPGTSEDIALLLAYERGAELITVVGGHSSFIDFLEKGRPGMGSTFLVRLKTGSVLVDARGVNKLYRSKADPGEILLFLLSALMPVGVLILLSPLLNQLLRLMILNIRLLLGI